MAAEAEAVTYLDCQYQVVDKGRLPTEAGWKDKIPKRISKKRVLWCRKREVDKFWCPQGPWETFSIPPLAG